MVRRGQEVKKDRVGAGDREGVAQSGSLVSIH